MAHAGRSVVGDRGRPSAEAGLSITGALEGGGGELGKPLGNRSIRYVMGCGDS